MMPSVTQLLVLIPILLILFVTVILPIILVAKSERSTGAEKLAWVLLTLLLSWIGYIIFHVTTSRRAAAQQNAHSDQNHKD